MHRIESSLFIGRLLIISTLLTLTAIAPRAQSVRYEIVEIPQPEDMEGFWGTDILQDSEGFMWFGSNQGLYRYDGTGFKKFKNE
jgi:ligand-binding sensor domain-containing protein